MKRRDFLQGASWTTLFWGLNLGLQANADSLSDRPSPWSQNLERLGQPQLRLWQPQLRSSKHSWQGIAAPTARKFALLVGLNHYADNSFPALTGCLTDLELQQQLLCHRYGFAPQDILILADQQATVSNFQAAVTTHLSNQVQQGDVVVFHFSGYGTQVQGAAVLVLFDQVLPLTQWQGWLRSLPTPFITTILDTSFVADRTPFSPNFSSRSLPPTPPALITPSTVETPASDQDASLDQVLIPTDQEVLPLLPGVLIRATSPGQEAVENSGNGFRAGLFTYLFTQQLWQSSSETTQTNLEQLSPCLQTFALQQPFLVGKTSLPPFFLSPELIPPADGFVMEIAESVATLWLGGIPPQILSYYEVDSVMAALGNGGSYPVAGLPNSGVLDSENPAPPTPLFLQITDRTGLQAKAKILTSEKVSEKVPKTGTLLREVVRVLPRQIPLRIAFDRQLTRVERVDATSAFASIAEVSLGKDPADYLFTTSDGSYGLSTLRGDAIPTTQGQAGEAVKSAVSRLKYRLHSLLATKLLYLTENSGYQRADHLQMQMTKDPHNPQQYWLENKGDRHLWGLIFCSTPELWVLGLDSGITGITTYELLPQARISVAIPKKLTTTPTKTSNTGNIYGIFSSRPFDRTLEVLNTLDPESKPNPSPLKLSQPLPVIKALYQDLQTPDSSAFSGSSSDNYILDINTWATFWL